MIDNEKDIKDIEEQINIRDSEILGKYGLDIKEQLEKEHNLRKNKTYKRVMKTIKISFNTVVTLILVFMIGAIAIYGYGYYQNGKNKFYIDVKEMLEIYSGGAKVKLKSKDVDSNGNGMYIYTLKEFPQIEVHATRTWAKLQEDTISRIHKYFFDTWQNDNKDRFVVNESYIDSECMGKVYEDWILDYSTYIEVENYKEFLEALDLNLEFEKYKSTFNWDIYISNNIMYEDSIIAPHTASGQTMEDARENAIYQYIQIVKRKRLSCDDIPKDKIEKYWNMECFQW